MSIIGVSGKIGTGKDEVGKIIQYLTSNFIKDDVSYSEYIRRYPVSTKDTTWEIHKFADALKDIVCILTGCTREQLEDRDFKNTCLSSEWNKLEGITYRQVLQFIGTDLLRNQLHENCWINALFSKYESEIWKDITNYEGVYQVSNFGNIIRFDRYIVPVGNTYIRFR